MTNERLVRNAARPTKRHYSVETTFREERIACVCGEVVRGEPDAVRDRHGPLLEAYRRHCGRTG